MRTTSTRAAVTAALLGGSVNAWALGLGAAHVTAVLGQALEATVSLRLEGSEQQLGLDCIEAKVFFGEERLLGSQVRLSFDGPVSNSGERLLRISTLPVVNEPLVSLVVGTRCGSIFTREYVAFADPPAAGQTQPLSFPPVALPQTPLRSASGSEAVSGRRSPLAPAEQSAPSSRNARSPVRSETNAGTKPVERLSAKSATNARPQAAPLPQLKLEPVLMPPATPAPHSRSEEAAHAVTAAAMPLSAPPPSAAELARLRAVEATLAEMRSEMAQTRRMLQALEAQARQKEPERHRNLLLYALSGLAAALSVAVGWLLLERRRERLAAGAWDAELLMPHQPKEGEGDLDSAPKQEPQPEALDNTAPSAPVQAMPPSAPVVDLPLPAPEPLEMSAVQDAGVLEELLDLDQQMAFLIALGQDESVIELLQTHLGQKAAGSPLPWLELLSLHQRRNERDAFESTAKHFAARFSTSAPAWQVDLCRGRTLEDYPGLIDQLERQWQNASATADVLEGLLLSSERWGAEGGPELPACQDLLLLYAIVRERFGSELPENNSHAGSQGGWSGVEGAPRMPALLAGVPEMSVDLLLPEPGEEADPGEHARTDGFTDTSSESRALPPIEIDFEPLEFDPPASILPGASR